MGRAAKRLVTTLSILSEVVSFWVDFRVITPPIMPEMYR